MSGRLITLAAVTSPSDATWRNVWKRPAVVLSPLATFLAIVGAFVTVSLTIRSNTNAEKDRQRSAFALAAAQVVMNQPTCELSQARARTLIALFPEQLEETLEPLTRPSLSIAECDELRTSSLLKPRNG